MPGKLDPVSQNFTADTSGYIAALEKAITGNIAFIDSIDDVIKKSGELAAALKSIPDTKRISVEVTGLDAAIGKVGELKTALDSLSDREITVNVRHTGDTGAGAAGTGGMGADPLVLRELRDSSASLDMVSSTMGRVEEHLAIMRRDMADASADLMSQTAMMRSGGGGRNANDAAVLAAAALGMAGGGRRGGRGGGGGAGALGALAGAAGPAGADAGGGGFMTAAQYADKMLPFIKRWAGIAHYAIMGVNEALATILPATMAAGAATLVGWQGVEQMMPRLQAINATAESIGGAYGITSGQYLGTGSKLQQFQNLATGGVYELGGAGINLMRQGAGTFGQVGLSTIAMIDRGVADMQINMAQRGTMGTLGGILGSGTGYLQQFGGLASNLGNIFLGLAPHLPGVGGDYLSALQGITGGLAGGIGFMNQHGMGNVLGAGLAAEAGWRVGTPMLGLLGRALGGIGGGVFRLGAGTALGDAGLGIAGAGEALGALTGPEVAAMALMAYGGAQLVGYKDSAQKHIGTLQTGITQAGFSAALKPLAQAITTTSGLAGVVQGFPGAGTPVADGRHLPAGRVGAGIQAAQGISDKNLFTAAATGFTQTMGDLVNAGPQLVDAIRKAGLKGVSMADAFQIAQNSLIDLSHAFGPDGKLNKQALQMVTNTVTALGPMTRSAGGFNAAIAAQQVMSAPAMKDLANVNQAMDQMTGIMTGGPAGMAALFGMLGGAPVKKGPTRAGIQLQAPPAFRAMAQALTSFTTAGGAAAWNTFAGQNGLISTEQQNLDQLRTYMTLGAMPLQGKTGAQGVAAFQLMQMLPMAGKSPAALAMLMQQGAQMGVGGYYDPSKSLAQNLKAAEQSFTSMAGSAKQVNQGMNRAVEAVSNLPAAAAQFVQGTQADIRSQMTAQAATDIVNLRKQAGKGHVAGGALKDLQGVFSSAGISPEAMKATVDASLKQAGISQKMTVRINAQLDASQAKAAIANLTHVTSQPKVTVKAEVAAAQAAINAIKGKDVPVSVKAQGIGAIQAAIDSLHGKTVTITTINRLITQVIGMGTPAGGGIAPATLAGGPAGMRLTAGHAAGYRVPGYGGGDIHPALLEGGEAVVPKHLVPGIAPYLAAHRVPGFAGGGFIGQQMFGPMAYWGAGSSMAMFNPAWYAQIAENMRRSQGTGVFAHPQAGGGGVHPYALHAASAGGTTLAQVDAQIKAVWKTLDRLYKEKDAGQNVQSQISAIWKNQLDPLYARKDKLTGASGASGTAVTAAQLKQIAREFNVHLGGEIAKEVKDSAAAKSIATALVSKIATEMKYATGVADAAAYGQGYDPTGRGSGIFGGMQLNPSGLTQAQMHASPTGNIKDYNAYVAAYAADQVGAGAPQSVQDQMKSYLATEKSFGADVGKLRKQHLNKQVLAQIIAAGPQQGDALAQSILGGQGGAGAVNNLWGQIQKASKKLGAQAAMGQYGGHLSPDLKSGTFVTNNVSVSVSAGGSGGGTTLSLTDKQISQLVALIQARLLQQARRNNKTGIKAKGKGA